MKNFSIIAAIAVATSTMLGGCISVERNSKPESVTTRTTTSSSSLLAPSSTTTVQRTTRD